MKINIVKSVKLFLKYLIALILNLLKDKRALEYVPSTSSGRARRTVRLVRINVLWCVYLFFISSVIYPLSYDNATYAAQQGKWKEAHTTLNNILVNAPDRADVLFDAGVAAANIKNFSQAAACFLRAAECSSDDQLRLKAHFNAGNALVEKKELHNAIDQYDKVLAIDSTDEYARHNRDRVKQMLEEQKKEQDQQKQDQQKKDEQKNDQEKEDQDKQDQQQSDDDKKEHDDQGKQNQNNDSSKTKSDEQSEGDQGDDTDGGNKDTEGKNHRDKEKDKNNTAKNQQGDRDQSPQGEPDNKNDKSDTKHGDKHKDTPEKQSKGSDTNVAPHAEQDQAKDAYAQNDDGNEDELSQDLAKEDQHNLEKKLNNPWLLQVLNNQEAKDKAMNKQLIEAKIRQHGGKNGQNCW